MNARKRIASRISRNNEIRITFQGATINENIELLHLALLGAGSRHLKSARPSTLSSNTPSRTHLGLGSSIF